MESISVSLLSRHWKHQIGSNIDAQLDWDVPWPMITVAFRLIISTSSCCVQISEAFDSYDPGGQLTLTLPASYWYLKGLDIKRLEKYVDWFNVMTYDIHGLWDQHYIWTGPFLKGHTNIKEMKTVSICYGEMALAPKSLSWDLVSMAAVSRRRT
jgi:hypothetical protein